MRLLIVLLVLGAALVACGSTTTHTSVDSTLDNARAPDRVEFARVRIYPFVEPQLVSDGARWGFGVFTSQTDRETEGPARHILVFADTDLLDGWQPRKGDYIAVEGKVRETGDSEQPLVIDASRVVLLD